RFIDIVDLLAARLSTRLVSCPSILATTQVMQPFTIFRIAGYRCGKQISPRSRAVGRILAIFSIQLSTLVGISFSVATDANTANDARWWPVQTLPKALVRLDASTLPGVQYQMIAQSVAGLAAKATNEG